MLDIGGDVGAVVAHLDAPTASGELDIQPSGDPSGRFHTGVHLRPVAGGPRWMAIFPNVGAGRYELLDDAGRRWATVDVTGGAVTEVELSPR